MAKKIKRKSARKAKQAKKPRMQKKAGTFSGIFGKKTKQPVAAAAAKPFEAPKAMTQEHREARGHLIEKQAKVQLSRGRFFEKVGRLLPDYFTLKAKELLMYNGKDDVHVESWVGKLAVRSIIATLLVPTVLYLIKIVTGEIFLGIFAGLAFVVLFAGPYAMLSIGADKRAKEIEAMLPSALQLMSANIRAGMTPDKAIWLAARPEFGVFMREIKHAGAQTMGGTPITEAFINMSKRVRSRTLERTVKLIVEGLDSGGEIAKLLNETAAEIRAMSLLHKEMEANVAMYSMFIVFAALIGAPLLLAISTFFVEMLTKLTSLTGISEIVGAEVQQAGLNLVVLSTTVTAQFLTIFSVVIITVTSFAASLLIGVIKEGNERRGLELAPVFIIVGLVMFALVKLVIGRAFGGIFGG